jgi:hypothetical protein
MLDRFVRRSRVAMAGLALCGGISGVALAATAGTASADPGITTTLAANSSGLVLDVKGASMEPGPDGVVIQWYPNGQANQNWVLPAPGSTGFIRNQNSGMCLTTDGAAGDQLYQEPCDPNLASYEQWNVTQPGYGQVELYNPWFDLAVDVYNDSSMAGQPIDAWYPNEQPNQTFFAWALASAY